MKKILERVADIDFIDSGACLECLENLADFLRENREDLEEFLKNHGWDNPSMYDFFFCLNEGLDDYNYLYHELSKAKADFLALKNNKAQKIKKEREKSEFEKMKKQLKRCKEEIENNRRIIAGLNTQIAEYVLETGSRKSQAIADCARMFDLEKENEILQNKIKRLESQKQKGLK